ncbi:MAG: rhodanese-like domain-containing protein [Xenophilus sp.]
MSLQTLRLATPAAQTDTDIGVLDVQELLRLLQHDGELALVDVREQGVYARDGHIIHAVPLPLSRLELRARELIPRAGVPVVVTDAGDGALAHAAAARLRRLGFTDLRLLEGGVAAWKAAGQQVYTGSGSYSKAFGEFVEHTYATPHISPAELQQKLDAGEVLLLDGRTLGEFEDFSIPGAHAIPNAELPWRIHALAPSADTPVVVHCAGRTRSIIGAQALINAGIRNPVAALEDGTMAWLFEGRTLQYGRTPAALPEVSGAARQSAQAAVQHLSRRYGIRWLDEAGLRALQNERDERSLYVLDVRSKAEYDAGHLPGARWAEGGELVQGLERFVGVRGARVVVVDDANGARAAITASWLLQLNRSEVYAHAVPEGADHTAVPAWAPWEAPAAPRTASLPAAALQSRLAGGRTVVLDLSSSLEYEAGHIPGAHFAIRSRLDARALAALAPQATAWVLTAADERLARFAAADLAVAPDRPDPVEVLVLEGGNAAWRAAGLPQEEGATSLLHPAEDVWRSPYQVPDRFAAFRAYLDWERQLLKQVQQDPTVRFRVFAEAP